MSRPADAGGAVTVLDCGADILDGLDDSIGDAGRLEGTDMMLGVGRQWMRLDG